YALSHGPLEHTIGHGEPRSDRDPVCVGHLMAMQPRRGNRSRHPTHTFIRSRGFRLRTRRLRLRGHMMTTRMSPDRSKTAHDLLAFYLEAGVDAVLADTPIDRFADPEPARPPGVTTAATARAEPRRATVPPPAVLPAAPAAPLTPDAAVMAAREAARSAASLEELRAILDRFEGCALKTHAKQLVFCDGNPEGRV